MLIHESIAQGATIQEAQDAAVLLLGAPEGTAIEFEVLAVPQKKTLGLFGGNPAKVRAFYETPEEASKPGRAEQFLRGVVAEFGIGAYGIESAELENGARFSLTGAEVSALIGRRGEVLDALQYLTALAASKGENEFYRVSLDVGAYREKREKALEATALRAAEMSREQHRNQILEPMSAYERRIVHTAVQGVEGVESWSVGDGEHRRVVIGDRNATAAPPRSDTHGDRPERAGRPRRDFDRGGRDGGYGHSDRGADRGGRGRPSGGYGRGERRPPYKAELTGRAPHKDADAMPLYGRVDRKGSENTKTE